MGLNGTFTKKLLMQRLSGKLSKEQSNYRPSKEVKTKRSCAECQNYETPGASAGSCVRVAGAIEARDVCDLFVPREGQEPAASNRAAGNSPGVTINVNLK